MNTIICAAIAKREVLQFRYAGGLRTVQPYRHGRSTAGNEVLRGYQVTGFSSSRQPTGWKLFDVGKMANLQQTSETFSTNRSGYSPKERAMIFVHCQV